MKRLCLVAFASLALAACQPAGGAASGGGGGHTGPTGAGPSVVSTSPALNSTVPSSTTSVSVTYNRPMRQGAWSFVERPPAAFPTRTGSPTMSEDRRTITLPVRMAPNTSYTVWLNSESFTNFKDEAGNPATPYVLTFRTGD